MITSKEAIHFPPNTGKTVHFPSKKLFKITLYNTQIIKNFSLQYHIHIFHQDLTEHLLL